MTGRQKLREGSTAGHITEGTGILVARPTASRSIEHSVCACVCVSSTPRASRAGLPRLRGGQYCANKGASAPPESAARKRIKTKKQHPPQPAEATAMQTVYAFALNVFAQYPPVASSTPACVQPCGGFTCAEFRDIQSCADQAVNLPACKCAGCCRDVLAVPPPPPPCNSWCATNAKCAPCPP